MKLQDKVAIITGGGTGIGRACAVLFAQEGAKVALVGRRAEPLQEVERQIQQSGGMALSVQADVTSEEDVKRMTETVFNGWGRMDVLINSAGTSAKGSVWETSVEDFDRCAALFVVRHETEWSAVGTPLRCAAWLTTNINFPFSAASLEPSQTGNIGFGVCNEEAPT